MSDTHRWLHFSSALLSAIGAAIVAPTTLDQGAGAFESSTRSTSQVRQIVITGTVRDAQSGRPVEGAQVQLLSRRAMPVMTLSGGQYTLMVNGVVPGTVDSLQVRRIGYESVVTTITLRADTLRADISIRATTMGLTAVVVEAGTPKLTRMSQSVAPGSSPAAVSPPGRVDVSQKAVLSKVERDIALKDKERRLGTTFNREQYDRIEDNPFLAVGPNPLSTFSIDVDRASYGNVRRFVTQGQKPPVDAVRIEELINYFPYALNDPEGKDPVAVTTEVSPAPWQPRHRLVRIALQARRIETEALPASNLVFLIDVSGSMATPDKLPLVKQSLRLLVDQLREQDRVAIVVYAGAAGLVLPSTAGSDKARIAEAIDRLEAGGSTAGGAGIALAYRTAKENFFDRGNNRVILATDGDFNVGASSDADMERLIESKRSEGTYLTVLGFGTGNYQDAKMEKLAKKGNGNYAYVDDLAEARKVLVHELGATLVTVANDVKLQVEFNPSVVSAYRLIGYEDRLLRNEDFTDDRKDAGDIGAGHAVTALYEVVPVGVRGTTVVRGVDSMRYVSTPPASVRGRTNELMYVKLRYKRPGESSSRLLTHTIPTAVQSSRPSDDFRFAASVAAFGMLLRDSEHKGSATGNQVLQLARGALGEDVGGYRADFVRMVERWQEVVRTTVSR